jgi:hypothetical protein
MRIDSGLATVNVPTGTAWCSASSRAGASWSPRELRGICESEEVSNFEQSYHFGNGILTSAVGRASPKKVDRSPGAVMG